MPWFIKVCDNDIVDLFISPNREVDKVLSGLEILSKVFDQQSAFMVSKMIQQVRIFASFMAVAGCV